MTTTALPRQGSFRMVESGQMHVRIGHDKEGVSIDFGKNISGIKISPLQAEAFAKKILEEAMAARIGV